MNDYWNARLVQFRQSPVVDIYGVVIDGIHNCSDYAEPDIKQCSFAFGAWRIVGENVQLTRLPITMIVAQREIMLLSGLGGLLNRYKVAHIKAHIIKKEDGSLEALYVKLAGPVMHDKELNEFHRQLNEPFRLDLPPLPPLWNNQSGQWEGRIVLNSWANFYLARYKSHERSGIEFPLDIMTEEMPVVRTGYKGVPPTPAQIAAYMYLIENDEKIRDAVLLAILEQYPIWQADYGNMPDVTQPIQLQSMLRLSEVTIQEESSQDMAYVYFSLLPQWDIEHGLAAVVHKSRVIAVGDHDSMCDVAEEDANLQFKSD